MVEKLIHDKLAKGDRVIVVIPYANRTPVTFTGRITGEARDGHAWHIIKDGTTWSRGAHKLFCYPEGTLFCRDCSSNVVERPDDICRSCALHHEQAKVAT
jgi:hypothetical protein